MISRQWVSGTVCLSKRTSSTAPMNPCFSMFTILLSTSGIDNLQVANSIVTGVTFAHFFEFCVDNNNEII